MFESMDYYSKILNIKSFYPAIKYELADVEKSLFNAEEIVRADLVKDPKLPKKQFNEYLSKKKAGLNSAKTQLLELKRHLESELENILGFEVEFK
jgi:hypothetical protein